MKKSLYGLILIATAALVLSGCAKASDETVEIGYWKDKLSKHTTNSVSVDLSDEIESAKTTGQGILGMMAETGKQIGGGAQEQLGQLTDKYNKQVDKLQVPWDELGWYEQAQTEVVWFDRAVDGDTIIVKTVRDGKRVDELRIRLIGCNTPESVAPPEFLAKYGIENGEPGKIASAFTKDTLKNSTYLWLKYDRNYKESLDPYNRTLAYVYLREDCSDDLDLLQTILLRNLIAEPMAIEPDTSKRDYFQRIYDQAVIDYNPQ